MFYEEGQQQELEFLVIRLPACHSCTQEKILVLDETVTASEEPPSAPSPTASSSSHLSLSVSYGVPPRLSELDSKPPRLESEISPR